MRKLIPIILILSLLLSSCASISHSEVSDVVDENIDAVAEIETANENPITVNDTVVEDVQDIERVEEPIVASQPQTISEELSVEPITGTDQAINQIEDVSIETKETIDSASVNTPALEESSVDSVSNSDANEPIIAEDIDANPDNQESVIAESTDNSLEDIQEPIGSETIAFSGVNETNVDDLSLESVSEITSIPEDAVEPTGNMIVESIAPDVSNQEEAVVASNDEPVGDIGVVAEPAVTVVPSQSFPRPILDNAISPTVLQLLSIVVVVTVIFTIAVAIRGANKMQLSKGLSLSLSILFTLLPIIVSTLVVGWRWIWLLYLLLLLAYFIFRSKWKSSSFT